MSAPENIVERLAPESYITVFELDYSRPAGDEGNPSMVAYLAEPGREEPVVIGGQLYQFAPMRVQGIEIKTSGTQGRPSLEIFSVNNYVRSLVESVGGDLTGAMITVKRYFEQHLDDGDNPNPAAGWFETTWRLMQPVQDGRYVMAFDLAAPTDLEVNLPLRVVEPDICVWAYKGDDCGWVPGAGPYFDLDDQPTTVDLDDCSRRYQGCNLRHGGRSQPLRTSAFPGTRRVVR